MQKQLAWRADKHERDLRRRAVHEVDTARGWGTLIFADRR
jgi:hypothetical protein